VIPASYERGTQSPRSPQSQRWLFFALFATLAFPVVACGKKGPPLPPLVKLPAAPADLTAERRGNVVDLQLTVPAANTDGTRPANITRVDAYAVTLPGSAPPIADAQLLKLATKVDTIEVKAPKDPDVTVDPDDPDEEAEPVEGDGLDQGAAAHVSETLTPAMLTPIEIPKSARAAGAAAPIVNSSGPLIGAPSAPPTRTYITVGISTRGKEGPLSKRLTVPLVPPPPAPPSAVLLYDETAVTLTWPAVSLGPISSKAGDEELLPSKPFGTSQPTIAYNVYDASGPVPVKLTTTAVAETRFVDQRMVWDEKRCYVVRTAETIGGLPIESDASPQTCDTLKDTFPPAAPKALQAVPSDGAINLIWEPNTERDLAGYIVLRARADGGELQPVTSEPIVDPSFRDGVQPGVRFVYAVRAVDKAGNLSPLSNRAEETAR
jgi:hypothetical protein